MNWWRTRAAPRPPIPTTRWRLSTTYTYRIKAINGAGTSERSRWIHIDIPAAPVPDKPTGLSKPRRPTTQVNLTWDDPGDDSITGYVILRRHSLRGRPRRASSDELVSDTGTAAALTYTDNTVVRWRLRYTYRIKAINGARSGRALPLVPHRHPGGPVAGIKGCAAEEPSAPETAGCWSNALVLTVGGPDQ